MSRLPDVLEVSGIGTGLLAGVVLNVLAKKRPYAGKERTNLSCGSVNFAPTVFGLYWLFLSFNTASFVGLAL